MKQWWKTCEPMMKSWWAFINRGWKHGKLHRLFFEKQCQKLGTVMYCIWKTHCWRSTKKGLIFKTIGIQLLKHPCEVSHVSQVTKNQQKKKSDWKHVLPNFWGNLIQLFSIFGTAKPSEIFFGPSSQRLKICWGQCHGGIGGQQGWMRCHLAVVNPPWLFVLPRTWHEPSQDSMEWNWWCFCCSLLLKWAKQNSTPPPNPSRTLQSSVDLAICT